MAEDTIAPMVFNLKDAGKQIAISIDLYDEGQFGADKLALRGRFTNPAEIGEVIKQVLAIGSPIENPASDSNILAFNRFNSPSSHWMRYAEDNDPYKNKAGHIVYFRLVIHWADFTSQIGFGVKWPRYRRKNGKLNKRYPLGRFAENAIITIDDLRLLDGVGISKDDAYIILAACGLSNATGLDVINLGDRIKDEQLDYIEQHELNSDEQLTSYVDPDTNEEYVVKYDNALITVEK